MGSPKSIARYLAQKYLGIIRDSSNGSLSHVRLRDIRRMLLIKRVKRSQWLSPREGAMFMDSNRSSQLSLFPEIEISIGRNTITSRFTYAHELAHCIATTDIAPQDLAIWSKHELEQFCDEFASQILVPDDLLLSELGKLRKEQKWDGKYLTPKVMEALYRTLRAPLSVIVKRMDDILRSYDETPEFVEVLGSFRSCVMVVCLGISRKRQANRAPRILTRCLPKPWFIPNNKRLETVGMTNLNRAFFDSPVLEQRRVFDYFTMWNRQSKRLEKIGQPIDYCLYPGSSVRQEARVMLATFELPAL